MSTLPQNVHISKNALLRVKISQLRSSSTTAKEVKQLVHEISLIIAAEALADLETTSTGTDVSPLGFEYKTETILPEMITVVPILRSGLSMLDAVQTLLPCPCEIRHLGLFRESTSLQPVEYYNNLPKGGASQLAIIIDPLVATGGTSVAAIQTLREWGVERIIFLSVLSATQGLKAAAEEWPEATELWTAGVDEELTDHGYLKPGLGDIGDRLYLTAGH